MVRWIIDTAKLCFEKIAAAVKDAFQNLEATLLLVAAAVGTSAVLHQVPFYVQAPLWIETGMIIPVISVGVVYSLVKLSEWRTA